MIVTSIDGTRREATIKTDAELVHELCAQNGEALECLFNRHVRLVRGIAQRILNDRAEAEDVTQEVFLEIYRKAHLYSAARGTFKVWLLQYVYHRTLRRKAALRRRAAYRGEPLEAVDDRLARPAHPAHGRQALSPEECRWVLRSGLARLPQRQRTTLELTCFEDLPLRDVAKRLGVSVGCTRNYYYRGLARLREWACVMETPPAAEGRIAAPAGTADAARDRGPRLYARVGSRGRAARQADAPRLAASRAAAPQAAIESGETVQEGVGG
jgi:RNA polymerase sigma-70 factor (ECF subfamily)